MKRTLNTLFHGIGYLLVCIGLILMIGMAGTSDCGGELEFVARIGLCGLAAGLTGVFLVWWRV